MQIVALDPQWVDYTTDLGVVVRAWRALVSVEFVNRDGVPVKVEALLDSGAPFCAIPHKYWHGRNMDWHPLGSQVTQAGQSAPQALVWFQVPSRLGETSLSIVDRATGTVSRPLRVVGKFPIGPLASSLEDVITLGCNFIVDNDLEMTHRRSAGQFSGELRIN